MLQINRIYNMDCLDGLDNLDNNSIDLMITSPPYNLGIEYDTYDDNLPINNYIEFIQNVCNKLYKIIKKGGRVCFNVPPDVGVLKDNSKVSLDTIFYNCLVKSGFTYRTKIIWNKNQITARTAWGSFCSPSNPNILSPFEYILVFYKQTPKKEGDKTKIDITKEEFIKWTNGIWTIGCESKKKINHPAPYPEELCRRLIKFFSYVGDVVLDPFMGSGTTAVVAKKLNRNYIGFELSNEYCNLAKERLQTQNII